MSKAMSNSNGSGNVDLKRKAVMYSGAMLPSLYYVLKNRNIIYRSSELLRFFHLKEILMRSFLGFMFGFGLSIYLYGGEKSVKDPTEYDEDGEEIDKTSLQYSIGKKKDFNKSKFLPGKIRD